jgi:hypothetical protein
MPWHELERQAIEIALVHTRGNKPLAARLLGIAPRTIYRHLNRMERDRQPGQDPVEVKDRRTIAATISSGEHPPQDPEVKKWKAQGV